jgi:hypothetical protein
MVAITGTYRIENHKYHYKKYSLQYPKFLTTLFKMEATPATYCIKMP